MNHRRLCAGILLFFLGITFLSAQELNCKVEINSDKVQATNKQVFETLQTAITEYLNENHFTNAQFAVNERIECRMFFTIAEYSTDTNTFKGDLQVHQVRLRMEGNAVFCPARPRLPQMRKVGYVVHGAGPLRCFASCFGRWNGPP